MTYLQRISSRVMRLRITLHHPLSLNEFIMGLPSGAEVLDVGCGNESPTRIKGWRADISIDGVDVGEIRDEMNLRVFNLVEPETFASAIHAMGPYDAVISNHNLEHVNDRGGTFAAMAQALKPGGRIFLATPSAKSTRTPTRGGTLNFFDDSTHKGEPIQREWLKNAALENNLLFAKSRFVYRPPFGVLQGLRNEIRSRRLNAVLGGTWALWGFEQIHWLEKQV